MKKIVILQRSGNELANQLWNYASIYAYALERGFELENPSFFEYGNHFTMLVSPGFKFFFFNPFTNYTKRKTALKRRIWRKFYFWYAKRRLETMDNQTIHYENPSNAPYYLAPTKESTGKLLELEKREGNIYLDSWLFRNPAGLQKYRGEILRYFKPRADTETAIEKNIRRLRTTYTSVIGVHIRQGDYETWRGGAYFVPQARVREILDECIKMSGQNAADICFVITSDGRIDEKIFDGLNVFISKENAVHDLFLLAKTDVVIGSNSTFGAFASYYGNIPFIVMQKEAMDWKYYSDKKSYFENKYSTFVCY